MQEINKSFCAIMENISILKNKWFNNEIDKIVSTGMSKADIARHLDVAPQYLNSLVSGARNITDQFLDKFIEIFNINQFDLLYNNNTNDIQANSPSSKNLIPFYDDVSTIGGVNTMSASMEGRMPSNEFIDAGDWFIGATAAIRHYGDSMNEYPSGCILALKEIHDKRQIVWGRNYCVETDEMRVTKRLQAGSDEYLMAYSTNTETYPDGHLVHEPFPIYKETIRRIFMVIGCVIKEYSSGPVMIKND